MKKPKSVAELMSEPPRAEIKLPICSKWNGLASFVALEKAEWCLNPESLALVYGDLKTGAWMYEIDLERSTTSAGMLDWIMQVNKKQWANSFIVGNLVAALDELFDPQGCMCSFGDDSGSADAAEAVKNYLVRLKNTP